MGILDRIKRKREEQEDWLQERVNYWKEKYGTFSREELTEILETLNRKALVESWDSPYGWSFWVGGLKARLAPDLDTEIRRQVIKELLGRKEF
jgi:hypothetical protein